MWLLVASVSDTGQTGREEAGWGGSGGGGGVGESGVGNFWQTLRCSNFCRRRDSESATGCVGNVCEGVHDSSLDWTGRGIEVTLSLLEPPRTGLRMRVRVFFSSERAETLGVGKRWP